MIAQAEGLVDHADVEVGLEDLQLMAVARPAGPAPTTRTATWLYRALSLTACLPSPSSCMRSFTSAGTTCFDGPDEVVVALLEDRGVRVAVDRHDRLGVGDTDHVLDRAGDAQGDIQLRADGGARLADLIDPLREALLDGGPRGPLLHADVQAVLDALHRSPTVCSYLSRLCMPLPPQTMTSTPKFTSAVARSVWMTSN